MNPRAANAMAWGAVSVLAALCLLLALRNLLGLGAHVPLDPNEGWNAAHVLRLAAGGPLYPGKAAWMVNNYPPLSFYLTLPFAWLGGDPIIVGRVFSVLAFTGVCAGMVAVLQGWGCDAREQALGAGFFAGVLLVGSNYVAMNDPQMLGHALQIAALVLLQRGRSLPAALLFALSLFVKHNLLAMPAAAVLALYTQDRGAGLRFGAWTLAFTLAGMLAFELIYDADLLMVLASPRLYSLANILAALKLLWWAPLPLLLVLILERSGESLFCTLYAALALILGVTLAGGDGVDVNIFFDLAIALGLGLGLGLSQRWRLMASLSVAPLLLVLAVNFHDNNFAFTRAFRDEARADIAFLAARPGPVLCEQFSLCQWAGKGAAIDVFNMGEAIKSGARDPKPLVTLIAQRHFAVLQLDEMDALGPAVQAAIARHYRRDHADDNGSFLVPAH